VTGKVWGVTGISVMRLVVLLGILGVGFYGAMQVSVPAQPTRAAPAKAPVAAPAETRAAAPVAPAPSGLPPTVRRLAESPVTGPARPVILPDAVIDPAAVQRIAEPGTARSAAPVASRSEGAAFRPVIAASANVRGGPSTGFPVVGRLTRGEEVEVVEADASGWLRIRVQGDGIDGWVAARLLGN
jgi:hypothetical protein